MNTGGLPTDRQPVRVLIHGASGRMGQALLRLATDDPSILVVAAVSQSVDQRVVDGIPQFSASELENVPAFDVAIDFSMPAAFDSILALCVDRGVPLVCGTTGLDDTQKSALTAASTRIATLWSSNFSLGVAVLTALAESAARALPDWDCDIVESHHKSKLDAPSGTALSLGLAVEHVGATPRYASLRAGDVIGEHMVQFTTAGERIELIHRASNRDIFARGALHAAVRLVGRPPGAYRLADLIG
ncbi:MAG: 4-hydroxy-tetrahydrodipicolinate reductase [Luteimonas sp.]